MHDRKSLTALRAIVAIQQAQREQAQTVVRQAVDAMEIARSKAELAAEEELSAWAEWNEFLAAPLSMEYRQALAARAVSRGAKAKQAEESHLSSDAMLKRRIHDWRQIDARATATQNSLRKQQRRVARKVEEIRASGTEDRVTWKWFTL